jgi:Lrp/AsnC family leucine-responsive transcriptional regulator
MPELDVFDLRILDAVQRDGRVAAATLAEQVPLSPSQIHRRLQRLEAEGVVAGYHARLDPAALGLGLKVLLSVSLESHDVAATDRFRSAVRRLPAILSCYAVTGEADYLLEVVTPDLAAFSAFLSRDLLTLKGVRAVRSNIVLDAVKRESGLPLDHLAPHERAKQRKPR